MGRSLKKLLYTISVARQDPSRRAHKSQKPCVVVRADALTSLAGAINERIMYDLRSYVLVLFVKLVQSIEREAESFRKERAERPREGLDSREAFLEHGAETRDDSFIQPLYIFFTSNGRVKQVKTDLGRTQILQVLESF